MAYNKRQKLQENIEAIRVVFQLEREHRQATLEEQETLRKYSGFGGLKFILNPVEGAGSIELWKPTDRAYYYSTAELYSLLKANAADTREYRELIDSIKSSVNTAFYTPQPVVGTIAKVMKGAGVEVNRMLDPSAGIGKFGDAFKKEYPNVKVNAFEKDLLTGRILKALHPNDEVVINGFETIDKAVQGTFDIATSNIPFGDISVFDPEYTNSKEQVRRSASKTIHNYFFMKSLDMVREGGFVAFITSRGFMDSPSNNPIREEIAKNARLVGAFRLPDGMFRDEAGTDVGSDLVVLQKYTGYNKTLDPDTQAFCETEKGFEAMSGEDYSDISLNTHWWKSMIAPDREAIVATKWEKGTDPYGKPTLLFTHGGGIEGIVKQLSEYFSRDLYKDYVEYYKQNAPTNAVAVEIKKEKPVRAQTQVKSKQKGVSSGPVQLDLFALWDAIEQEKVSMEPRDYTGELRPNWHNGTIIVDEEQLGMLSQTQHHPVFTPMDVNDSQTAILKQYIKVRDSYDDLYRAESTEQKERPDLREQLNIDYDTFFLKFGCLNDRKNQKVLVLDAAGRDTMALEYSNGEKFVKADIFNRPVSFDIRENDSVESAIDALSASLNRTGGVDLVYMSEISGLDVEELKEQLRDRIFYNPIVGGYEGKDKFLSGNVVEKYDLISSYNPSSKELADEVQRSLAALKDVIPSPIAFEDLDFNFGERWMPVSYFSEFASQFFDADINIDYAPNLDEFVVTTPESVYDKVKITSEYAVITETGKTVNGLDLLRHALYNTVPNITHVIGYKPNGDTILGPDNEKIQLAASKIEAIREGFIGWINEHDQKWKESLAEMYNKRYNCFVRADYDGSHQTFPGIDMKSLSSYVNRNKKDVGATKEVELYKSQKDAVWMLLQNGGGICDHEVGTGKTVVMCLAAHEMKRLGIAHKPIIIGMKANVSEIAATYQAAYPNDRLLYATAKDFSDRKTFFNRIKNNDYDCIIMSHDQFTAIPQSEETMRDVMEEELEALEEALAVYGRSHSVGSRMLSGLEKRKENLVTELKNLNYQLSLHKDDVVDFKTMGIDHIFVDESQAFKNLAFTTRDTRVAGLGDPKGSQRARNLQYAIRTIQDRTGKDLGATFLSGTTISNSLTELYLLFKYLRPKALASQNIHSFDAWAAVFAKKSRDYEINVAGQVVMKERFRNFIKVPELASFYNEITDYKTAADVGLERPKMNVELKNIQPTADHQDFSKRLLDFANSGNGEYIFRGDLTDNEIQAKMLLVTGLGKKASLSPKLVNPSYHEGDDTKIGVAAKNISDYYYKYNEQKGTQFVFCDLSTPKKGEWNAYQELKDRLVNGYGIPEAEIQFMQDATTEKKRKDFISRMNSGDIRILLGSTTTLGTGVNAQQRCVAIHHLDLPWRPSDMEQRNGRGVRKGNEVARQYADNKVDVYIYAVEKSLDSYNFYLLQAKSEFIRQMKTGALGKRSFDQGGEDATNGMPFAEYVAITSGNTDLLERAKLEKRILGLESERKAYNAQRRNLESKLQFLQRSLDSDRRVLDVMRTDLEVFKANVTTDKEGKYVNTLSVGVGYVSLEEKGRYLQEQARRNITEEVEIGHIYGFPVMMRPQVPSELGGDYKGNIVFVKGTYSYLHNKGRINMASRNIAAQNPYEAIVRLPSLVPEYEQRIARLEREIPEVKDIVGKEWEKSRQLADMKKQLQELDHKIQRTMDSSFVQGDNGSVVDKPLFTIVQKSYGRDPWELQFKVSDYPFVSRTDRYAVEKQFHGNFRIFNGVCTGNFKHRYGAEEAMKELTRLNAIHQDDVAWLCETVKDVYDEACLPAYTKLREKGYDRYGKYWEEKDYHLRAVALGDYSDVRALAHGVKDRNAIAVDVAAKALARIIEQMPEAKAPNAVLVPMPGHKDDRNAIFSLTRQVSKLTGIPFEEYYLRGVSHDSLYDWKKTRPGEPLPELFFIEDKELVSQGRVPIIIDNVLDTGHTVRAALEALSEEPVLVVIGATGNHAKEEKGITVTIDEHSLEYIHNITPVGVGLTGMSQFQIDELISQFRSESPIKRITARQRLLDVGIDIYTGLPLYETYNARKRWGKDSDIYKRNESAKKIIEVGSYDKLFTEEERKYLSDEDHVRMNNLLEKCVSETGDDVKNDDMAHCLLVNYDYLKEKAAIAMEKEKFSEKNEKEVLSQQQQQSSDVSPVIKQYNELKAKHPDALLLFRAGNFYKAYKEDAEKASNILGITLTRHSQFVDENGNPLNTAGFPHHALASYLPKLIRAGERIAICDQLDGPKEKAVPQSGLRMQVVDGKSFLTELYGDNIQDNKLRDGLIERMRRAGIPVNTNVEEGERILQQVNIKPRLMAVDRNTDEYIKKVSDAEQRIKSRLAELNRSRNEDGSIAQPASRIPVKEPTSPSIDGDRDASSSTAKVRNKFESSKFLAEKMAIYIESFSQKSEFSVKDYPVSLIKGLGLEKKNNQNSEYIQIKNESGNTYTLRISDHQGNARNIILKGVRTDRGYSIVLHTHLSPDGKFKTSKWADVNEYVYNNPTKERLVDISKSIFGLFDTGEYVDIAHADEHNISPRQDIREQRVVSADMRYMLVPDSQSPIFISNARLALDKIKQEKATPEQWLNMIENLGGMKTGEDRWTGLSDWLRSSEERILTKQQVIDYINENQIQVEEVHYIKERNYGNSGDEDRARLLLGGGDREDLPIDITRLRYTTKGLDNNHEIALVVPTIESWNWDDHIHFGEAGFGRAVVWVRFGETVQEGSDERVLVIDEIQSKRHQEGREQGYRRDIRAERDAVAKVWAASGRTDDAAFQKLQDLNDEIRKREYFADDRPPAAPFEKNWQELAMKRMLRYAAENGYDRVAWTTGMQQVERYSLGGKADKISINHSTEHPENYCVIAYLSHGRKGTKVWFDATEKEVLQTFGKGIGEQLIKGCKEYDHQKSLGEIPANRVFVLSGKDMDFGGEGMKAFYDHILPNFANKYCKQWGVAVEDVELPAIGESMHSIPVTDQMKQDVREGQPMFFRNGERQAYGFVHNGTIYIDPRIATAETPIHEYTHLWAEVLRQRNPQEWKNIVQIMKNTPEVWNYVRQNYPDLQDEDQIADEALAQFSGQRGTEQLQKLAAAQSNTVAVFDKMTAALEKFWKGIAEFFGIHYTSKEQVADRILYDLLNEVNPLDFKIVNPQGLREQQESLVDSDNFKQWFGDWKTDPINASKVVDEQGRPLVVEHATNADFTIFDINHLGENSHDKGLFGAGFYFGTHAPGWLYGTQNVMHVYLDIKHPFEIGDLPLMDMYSEFKENLDTPSLRGMNIMFTPDRHLTVGEYIDHIKAVDTLVAENPELVKEMMAKDEELEFIHPKERERVWREHEIINRTGFPLCMSWQSVITDQIDSEVFSAALKKDGYDGIIVDRAEGYKEYVAFDAAQIKSATDNVGLFNRNNPDIRYHLTAEEDAKLDASAPLSVTKESTAVQGLEEYSVDSIKKIVANRIEEILAESGLDDEITINEVSVIGSRSRGEAHEGSDLDILVEYEGDYREDALFDLLHKEDLNIKGISIDVNPINPRYSMDTAHWLARDARWREEDDNKNNIKKQENMETSDQLQTRLENVRPATLSEDGETVSVRLADGTDEKYTHIHGGTHDDPALIYSNTQADVFFYDSAKKNIESIDNEVGIDAYENCDGIFLVRSTEYEMAYQQLEEHDRTIVAENKEKSLISAYPQLKKDSTMEEKKTEAVVQEQKVQQQQEEKKEKVDRFANLDYTVYSLPEGVTVDKANIFKLTQGENAGKYALFAVINGERKTRVMYKNDLDAYFDKNAETGKRRAELDQLVAKYFGKSAEKQSVDTENKAENEEAQQKQAELQTADSSKETKEVQEQTVQEQQEDAKKEKKESIPSVLIQAELLAAALGVARAKDGAWLNKDGKQAPDFIQKGQVISPFNALMMSLHSDAHGYKTNQYLTFNAAKTAGVSVKKDEKGLPFNWYNWDKYVSRINSNDIIKKEQYDALPVEEKDIYKQMRSKEERKIFNIDQTTMSAVSKTQYKEILDRQEKSVLGRGVKETVEVPSEGKSLYDTFKEQNPDTLLVLRTGDDHFELHGADAEKAASILHIDLDRAEGKEAALVISDIQLDKLLPQLVRDGQRVSVQSNLDKPEMLRRYDIADRIYDKVNTLVEGIVKCDADNLVVSGMKSTGYDVSKDILTVNDSRAASPGEEVSTAIRNANDVYRAVVAYTGAETRLNRGLKGKMLPDDVVKYDKLVQEVSAGVLMARQGLPATISKSNLPLVPYWQRELKEDPKFVERLENDVNNALQTVSKLRKGETVDYAAMRGEKNVEAMKPRFYTIASRLAALPDMEKKHIVVVKDTVNKSAAVILPSGASLEVNNETPGLSKTRIATALKKEGYLADNIKFYNAGGSLGFHQSNEYFADKTIEVARLKQYDLNTISAVEVKDEIARTSKVDIEQVTMTRDNEGKYVLYAKPSEEPAFTVYPEADDVRLFFDSVKSEKFDDVREGLGQKYYAFVKNHPDFNKNILMPAEPEGLDLSRITKVSIVKDKYKDQSYIMFATIDGESQKPREISGLQAKHMWLVDDKDIYKVRLAALLFEDKLGLSEGQSETQFRDNNEGQGVDEGGEQETPEEEQQTTRRAFHR